MICHAAESRVHVRPAQLLDRHLLAGRRADERRTAEENGAGVFDDDGFIGHRRHVRAAGRRPAHDGRDLRDLAGRHDGLVVEDAAEMFAIREDLCLQRQKCAARIDEVNAGQPIL